MFFEYFFRPYLFAFSSRIKIITESGIEHVTYGDGKKGFNIFTQFGLLDKCGKRKSNEMGGGKRKYKLENFFTFSLKEEKYLLTLGLLSDPCNLPKKFAASTCVSFSTKIE